MAKDYRSVPCTEPPGTGNLLVGRPRLLVVFPGNLGISRSLAPVNGPQLLLLPQTPQRAGHGPAPVGALNPYRNRPVQGRCTAGGATVEVATQVGSLRKDLAAEAKSSVVGRAQPS